MENGTKEYGTKEDGGTQQDGVDIVNIRSNTSHRKPTFQVDEVEEIKTPPQRRIQDSPSSRKGGNQDLYRNDHGHDSMGQLRLDVKEHLSPPKQWIKKLPSPVAKIEQSLAMPMPHLESSRKLRM